MHVYKRGSVWWLKYHVAGKPVFKSLKTRDKRVAHQIAAQAIKKDARHRMGLDDPFEAHFSKDIEEHLADFEGWLRARGPVPKHSADRMKCLRAFVTFGKVRTLADLDAATASRWLASLRKGGLSARTVNGRYQALRQFAKLMVTTERMPRDPFASLSRLREADDSRHARRSLTKAEFDRLCKAARTRGLEDMRKIRGADGVSPKEERFVRRLGEDRARVYRFAVYTGLRAGEIARIRWCDVDLEKRIITIPAASAKSRRVQAIPLHAEIVSDLTSVRPADVAPATRIFGPRRIPNPKTVWLDLKAAGIERQDGTGRWIDFHALRTTFVSWLVAAGVHPRLAQRLARHASIETTMERYADAELLDGHAAIASLPAGTPKAAAD